MSAPIHQHGSDPAPEPGKVTGDESHGGWAMLLCCIPMVVAIVLIALSR